ncbi:hypothetical protein [Chryseobacterium sp.]|uniref:hypothetical protein n=1 Tax=Chryseobacterium sp. TaxID=1871047 RepID=UPI0025BA49E4|nr:hypothetical protein [Chryseobacterium sp.]
MKKTFIFIFSFGLSLVFGQKVSDFRYVHISEKFESFKDNQYGLAPFLSKALKGKKYVIVEGSKDNWPSELKQSPCNVINAEVLNDSSFLRNKVKLQFKDCNDKEILSTKGSSSIKDYEEGYRDALIQALIAVPVSNPVNNIAVEPKNEIKQEVIEKETVAEISALPVENAGAQKFSNGKLNLQRIQIDNAQFILADANSSVPYATFKITGKKDVFRVKLANGLNTIGYWENGNMVIELPVSGDEYTKEVFYKK